MSCKLFLVLVFVFCSQLTFAQLKGLIKDSLSNEAIPYVNIWVYDENIGTTANENGVFLIPEIEENKVLVFSAIGYKTKKLEYKPGFNVVLLQQDTIKLHEIVVHAKQKHKELKIGKFNKSKISFSFFSGEKPWILAKFFVYKNKYKHTPYLKKVGFKTNTPLDSSKFKLIFYDVNKNGAPGKFVFAENIICQVKKGNRKTKIDLSSYNIIFPEGGLFIAIEWLIIDDNKYEFKYTNPKGIKKLDGVVYFPSLGTIPENTNNNAWLFSKGKWSKNKKLLKGKHTPKRYVNKFPVLACELTLTN